MDYSNDYSYLVQRFLPGPLVNDLGYSVKEVHGEELDTLLKDMSLWGKNETEFEKKIKDIVRMYPLVFCVPKAVQRLQQVCMMRDISGVSDEALEKIRKTYPGIERHNSFADIETYVMYPSDNFYNSSKLAVTFPSDRVIVNDDIADKIEDIWNKNKKNLSAPCDLIETRMLPAPDIELQMEDTVYLIKICPEDKGSAVL